MADVKVYTVQPRFEYGDRTGGWSFVDQLFSTGVDAVPAIGSIERDVYLAEAWKNEPTIAGAFTKWVEKAKTVDWKISGGRNAANFYSRVCSYAENGRGWDYLIDAGGFDYLATDKGFMTEMGRVLVDDDTKDELINLSPEDPNYDKVLDDNTVGAVGSIQHFDATRMVKIGFPDMEWRYFPEMGTPRSIPDENIIQVIPGASGRERLQGTGTCAMSRLYDAKQLMVGYLTFFRQEIGELPPELLIIINGQTADAIEDSYKKYKLAREQKGTDIYSGSWWIGTNDAANRVDAVIHNLKSANKSFSYGDFMEWWAKEIALNTGESVGDYWLMQHPGNTNTLMSVQAMKAEATGVGSFLQALERRINLWMLPQSVTFEFDNKNDEQDKRRAEIMGLNITNLKTLSEIGGENPVLAAEKLMELAVKWDILSPEMVQEDDLPTVVTSTMKELTQTKWIVTRDLEEYQVKPLLAEGSRDHEAALFVMNTLKDWYPDERTRQIASST